MKTSKENHWTELWKTEDWLAVWVGFIIIILILSGQGLKMPSFRWTTGGELASFISKTTPALDKIIATAEEKGDKALAAQAVAVKVAFDGKDRKAIGDAVKSLAGIKDIEDEALIKRAAALSKGITTQVEALPGKVVSGGNIMQAVYIGLLYLLVSSIAFALMGEPGLKAVVGLIFPDPSRGRHGNQGRLGRPANLVVCHGLHLHRPEYQYQRFGQDGRQSTGCGLPDCPGVQYLLDAPVGLAYLRGSFVSGAEAVISINLVDGEHV